MIQNLYSVEILIFDELGSYHSFNFSDAYPEEPAHWNLGIIDGTEIQIEHPSVVVLIGVLDLSKYKHVNPSTDMFAYSIYEQSDYAFLPHSDFDY